MIDWLRKRDFLVISVGIVYLWFGILKFFPDLSPAEALARETIDKLTLGIIPSKISIMLLAIWETGIGIMLILNKFKQWVIPLALFHIILTFSPLLLFYDEIFINGAFIPSLLGQYIIKNIIILSVLLNLLPDIKYRLKFSFH